MKRPPVQTACLGGFGLGLLAGTRGAAAIAGIASVIDGEGGGERIAPAA